MADSARVLASVIIPVFNREELVGRALESALTQSSHPHEIIVVDDGSTDATAQTVAQVARRSRTVKYVYQPNSGVGAARNRGIEEATGDWIAFLDSDDCWLPHKLETALRVIARDPDVEFIFSSPRLSFPGDRIYDIPTFGQDMTDPEVLLSGFRIKTSTVLIKKTLLQSIGQAFMTERHTCEDYELFWRAVIRAKRIAHSPVADVIIDCTNDSLSRASSQVNLLRDNIYAIGRVVRWVSLRGSPAPYLKALQTHQYWTYQQLVTSLLREMKLIAALRELLACAREQSAGRSLRILVSALKDLVSSNLHSSRQRSLPG